METSHKPQPADDHGAPTSPVGAVSETVTKTPFAQPIEPRTREMDTTCLTADMAHEHASRRQEFIVRRPSQHRPFSGEERDEKQQCKERAPCDPSRKVPRTGRMPTVERIAQPFDIGEASKTDTSPQMRTIDVCDTDDTDDTDEDEIQEEEEEEEDDENQEDENQEDENQEEEDDDEEAYPFYDAHGQVVSRKSHIPQSLPLSRKRRLSVQYTRTVEESSDSEDDGSDLDGFIVSDDDDEEDAPDAGSTDSEAEYIPSDEDESSSKDGLQEGSQEGDQDEECDQDSDEEETDDGDQSTHGSRKRTNVPSDAKAQRSSSDRKRGAKPQGGRKGAKPSSQRNKNKPLNEDGTGRSSTSSRASDASSDVDVGLSEKGESSRMSEREAGAKGEAHTADSTAQASPDDSQDKKRRRGSCQTSESRPAKKPKAARKSRAVVVERSTDTTAVAQSSDAAALDNATFDRRLRDDDDSASVDPLNIVTSKRVRRPTQRYLDRRFFEHMIRDVPPEELKAALSDSCDTDDADDDGVCSAAETKRCVIDLQQDDDCTDDDDDDDPAIAVVDEDGIEDIDDDIEDVDDDDDDDGKEDVGKDIEEGDDVCERIIQHKTNQVPEGNGGHRAAAPRPPKRSKGGQRAYGGAACKTESARANRQQKHGMRRPLSVNRENDEEARPTDVRLKRTAPYARSVNANATHDRSDQQEAGDVGGCCAFDGCDDDESSDPAKTEDDSDLDSSDIEALDSLPWDSYHRVPSGGNPNRGRRHAAPFQRTSYVVPYPPRGPASRVATTQRCQRPTAPLAKQSNMPSVARFLSADPSLSYRGVVPFKAASSSPHHRAEVSHTSRVTPHPLPYAPTGSVGRHGVRSAGTFVSTRG